MNVRDSDSSEPSSPEPKRQRGSPPGCAWQYEWWVGARVMAQFVGHGGPDSRYAGQWFPAEVTNVREDDTVDVEYDDGDEEEKLHRDRVRYFTPTSRDRRAIAAKPKDYKDHSSSEAEDEEEEEEEGEEEEEEEEEEDEEEEEGVCMNALRPPSMLLSPRGALV